MVTTTDPIRGDMPPVLPSTSYRQQYERVRDDMAPLRGVDQDMVIGAELLERHAREGAARRYQSIDPAVVER